MSCEICGRSSCTRSFHSLESQQEFDEKFDDVKDRMRSSIERQINRLSCEEIDNEVYVKLDDVIDIINNY